MRLAGRTGPYFEVVEALSPTHPESAIRLGVRYDTFQLYVQRGLKSAIAQYYNLVQNGLTQAEHAFRGLERPLMLDMDMDADESIVIYSWRPKRDYEWQGDAQSGTVIERPAPPRSVFVVLTRPEPPSESQVSGSILKWNWIVEDSKLQGAPVEWDIRYAKKLWSRPR